MEDLFGDTGELLPKTNNMSLFAPHSPLESSIENTERHDFKKISMPNQFMVLS